MLAANFWNAPDDSNLTRMLNKGMIKTADGKPATVDDFRIILKSDLIINGPTAYLDSLPAELKTAITQAYLHCGDQGQGGVRQAVGRQEPALADHG